jgi:DNA-binding transcriptional ArsR family regulator
MPAQLIERVAGRFRMLGEPTRLRLLQALRSGPATVGALVERTGLGQANVSRHLQMLHRAGFVDRERDGNHVRYALQDHDVLRLCDLMCGRVEDEVRGVHRAIGGG